MYCACARALGRVSLGKANTPPRTRGVRTHRPPIQDQKELEQAHDSGTDSPSKLLSNQLREESAQPIVQHLGWVTDAAHKMPYGPAHDALRRHIFHSCRCKQRPRCDRQVSVDLLRVDL